MIEVHLTRGKVALLDEDDFASIQGYSWYADQHRNGRWYAKTSIRLEGRKTTLYMHNLIMGTNVDHINMDGLDNRKSNLRNATKSQNNANRRKYRNNVSGYKGVHPKRNKWAAQIRLNGKVTHIGTFESPLAAALAYDNKARELFGEYARTNL